MEQLSKKYRPKKFSDLIGQKDNVAILRKIIQDTVYNIPFLFTGPYGSGKTSASRVFAKSILCENLTAETEPCDECQSCIDFQQGKNINYTEMDAASHGDVQTIRELREEVNYSAIGSKFKITNIDEAHNISKQGYNALLKQLEEGAAHHIFIFCTNEPEKMLKTVRSRCWRIHSQPITPKMILENLKTLTSAENIEVEEEALKLISEVQAPHIRDAQNTIDFLRFKGKVERKDVENYFQIVDQNLFLEFFIHLKNDITICLSSMERLLDAFDIEVIFNKIIDLALICEGNKKGVEVKHEYIDPELLQKAFAMEVDFLAIANHLLGAEKPLDVNYLKCLVFELNRKLNLEAMPSFGTVTQTAPSNYSGATVVSPEAPPKPENLLHKLEKDIAKSILSDQIKGSGEIDHETMMENCIKNNQKVVESDNKDTYYNTKPRQLTTEELHAHFSSGK